VDARCGLRQNRDGQGLVAFLAPRNQGMDDGLNLVLSGLRPDLGCTLGFTTYDQNLMLTLIAVRSSEKEFLVEEATP
jgi:hypothetical protein